MAFLTAHWKNLILANFDIPEGLFQAYLPPGVEPDRRDGRCWGSLVAFQFQETRVLGIRWPGYVSFPEWNLRLYVRQGAERGVVFVREFVPQWLTATMARLLYNEPYRAAQLTESIRISSQSIIAAYTVTWGGKVHTLEATGTLPSETPPEDSLATWYKEHRWGYGTGHWSRRITYEVRHPRWAIYPVTHWRVDVDWAKLYGPAWSVLQGREPESVFLAVGSPVEVDP